MLMSERRGGLPVDRDLLLKTARDELDRERDVWEMHRTLSAPESQRMPVATRAYLKKRFQGSLAHLFTLIALAYPKMSVRLAFEALGSDDRIRRGVALELLEHILPRWMHKEVWPYLGDDRAPERIERSLEEVLQDFEALRKKHESIEADLRKVTRMPTNEP